MSHAEHAQNRTRLAHLEAVFLPDGHRAKRESSLSLKCSELFRGLAGVSIIDICVGQKHSYGTSSAVKLEVVEFWWHMLLSDGGKVDFDERREPVLLDLRVMWTLEILLQICLVCNAIVERFKVRVVLVGLISQLISVLNVLEQLEIGNGRL